MTNPTLVLVTEFEYEKGKAEFESAGELGLCCLPAPADEAGLAEETRRRNARAVIVGTEPYAGPLYDALPAGGVIARFGVGHDSIDKPRCSAKGIVVANTPDVLNTAVAEHAMWLMGAAARRVPQSDAAMKAGQWRPATGVELAGKTLAVVGLGGIGRAVGRIAGLGFGMRVVGCDIMPEDAALASLGAADWEEARRTSGVAAYAGDPVDALAQADVVSAHIASTPATEKFFDAAMFSAMKPGAIFVNTARGAVVDEVALYHALRDGPLAAAGLDVFHDEPYAPASPDADLRTLDNVVLTPHVSSNTREANARMARAALENVAHALRGEFDRVSVVNPEALP